MAEIIVQRKSWFTKFLSFLISIILCFAVLNVGAGKVRADASIWVNDQWDDPDLWHIGMSVWGFNSGDTVEIVVKFDRSEVFLSDANGLSITGDGSATFTITYTFTGQNINFDVRVMNNGTRLSATVKSTTLISSAPAPTARPTAAPTPTPRPTAAPTPTPRAQATATPRAQVTPTPVPQSQATATPRAQSAATPAPQSQATQAPQSQPTQAPSQATEAPLAPVITENTPTPASTPEPTAEAAAATTETADNSDETIPEVTDVSAEVPEDAETETVDVDDAAAYSDSNEAGQNEGTPTPTESVRVAGTIKKKNNPEEDKKSFPWWILIILAILAGRYAYLRRQGYNNKETAIEFIPGGVTQKIIDKVHPMPKDTKPESEPEDAPVVVNGYLKKSNTAAIRPVYSNTPAARASEAAKMQAEARAEQMAANARVSSQTAKTVQPSGQSTGAASVSAAGAQSRATGLKPPIKRPKSLSSNRAAAMAAEAEENARKAAESVSTAATSTHIAATSSAAQATPKAASSMPSHTTSTPVTPSAKPASSVTKTAAATAAAASARQDNETKNKPPLKSRPPIKRPKELSSNRAAVMAAEAAPARPGTTASEADKRAEARKEALMEERRNTNSPFAAALARKNSDAAESVRTAANTPTTVTPAPTDTTPADNSAVKSPFRKSPFAAKTAGTSNAAETAAASAAAVNIKPAGSGNEPRPAARPVPGNPGRAGRGTRAPESTMNRPDASALNENATQTAAQQAFSKAINEQKAAPAIATQFVPPVVEKPQEEEKVNPFKPAPKAPIKRPSGLNAATAPKAEEDPEDHDSKKYVPPVAQFTPIPIIEKPASPFKPLSDTDNAGTSEDKNE